MNATNYVQAGFRPDCTPARPGEYLTFRLGAEEYAMDILKVQELRCYEAPTRVAGMPADVKGVINLRGAIVPIIDLRLRLGLERVGYDPFTVTVVLQVGGRVVGVVVDAVSDVIELAAGDIRPAPMLGCAVDARYVAGIGTLRDSERDRMLILADMEQLLAGYIESDVAGASDSIH